MSFEYYAENHDWDLTLRASYNLLMCAQTAHHNPTDKSAETSFSCLTGSMVLGFCALESYINSVAFTMSQDDKYAKFPYTEFKENLRNRFWCRLELVCAHLDVQVDASSGMFQKIKSMQNWRNSLVHSTPYAIETTHVQKTVHSKKLHKKHKSQEYTKRVNIDEAKKFYQTAVDFITMIKDNSGIDPRAMCSYKVLE